MSTLLFSPNAVKLGKFTSIPKPPDSPGVDESNKQLILPEASKKSRKFSQIAPASLDNPNAVQMGSKFTMIPTNE